MTPAPSPPRRLLPLAALAAAVAVVTGGGCYKRVVGVKNAPGYTGPVYEQNVDQGNEDLFRVKKVTPKGSTYVE